MLVLHPERRRGQDEEEVPVDAAELEDSAKLVLFANLALPDAGDGTSMERLQNRPRLKEQSPEFGDVFEAWIHHELKSFTDYHSDMSLHFWRTPSKIEVDFILNESIGIEVKAKTNVSDKDLKGLKALREEGINKLYVVSMETRLRTRDHIEILPWRVFLDRLWKHEL